MFTLYVTQNKTLLFATIEEAERFADTVETKTGKRPTIRESIPQRNTTKNLMHYGKIPPHYAPKN